jgi:hypothetical protein
LHPHHARRLLVRQRVALSNHIRGVLSEYGIVLPRGVKAISQSLPALLEDADNDLPMLARHLLQACRYLVIDFGTSKSPKSTRQRDSQCAPAALRPLRSAQSASHSSHNDSAETIIGLFKTEVIRRRGPWRNIDAVEYATLEWVDWFNHRRLLEPIGNIPPAELEQAYYQHACSSIELLILEKYIEHKSCMPIYWR